MPAPRNFSYNIRVPLAEEPATVLGRDPVEPGCDAPCQSAVLRGTSRAGGSGSGRGGRVGVSVSAEARCTWVDGGGCRSMPAYRLKNNHYIETSFSLALDIKPTGEALSS